LIYSNLMLHWCDQPLPVFRELFRVLRPGGLLLFSTFGPDTLQELREAWSSSDRNLHVSRFPDMPELADALMRAGFAEPVLDVEHHRHLYADAYALMRELKRSGASNAFRARARGLTGRGRFAAMIEAYERQRTSEGLPATFEIIAGAAFGGDAGSVNLGVDALSAGRSEVAIPLSSIRRPR
jgi:malonyl-CoA O-methyltransferase